MRLIALFTITVFVAACSEPQPRVASISGPTMGTRYNVKLVEVADLDLDKVKSALEQSLRDLNQSMSTYIPVSELSLLNKGQAGTVKASEQLLTVLAQAKRINKLSGGVFDITVGPLVNAWGFGPDPRTNKAPADALLQQLKSNIGSDHFQLDLTAKTVTRDSADLYMDLSAIAKGYAVDQLAEVLDQNGIKSYLVEIGGEVKTRSKKPDGQPWRIAVERPTEGAQQIQRVIVLEDIGIATSGDYRNYFEQDGVRYSHTIDPRTGYPINHNLASVSVLSKSVMEADAMATALMVMGPVEGMKLAEKMKLPVLMLVKENESFKEIASSAFNPWMKKEQKK
ncbi:FAD:protein FMN transferase [Pelagibaculum spongiae]|uniref:FAD:protein FMN transferase n=1 Tax=Pelagibaculum spongiae TaxID=2080658 RepID=A0A2V1GXT0_9GAMM|nr:FAD:protein FMN transferase [Pelagibaculum spongiae]PVZ69808.1 hypothetical protein DC094_10600 [Pelagibaculum spongiae]